MKLLKGLVVVSASSAQKWDGPIRGKFHPKRGEFVSDGMIPLPKPNVWPAEKPEWFVDEMAVEKPMFDIQIGFPEDNEVTIDVENDEYEDEDEEYDSADSEDDTADDEVIDDEYDEESGDENEDNESGDEDDDVDESGDEDNESEFDDEDFSDDESGDESGNDDGDESGDESGEEAADEEDFQRGEKFIAEVLTPIFDSYDTVDDDVKALLGDVFKAFAERKGGYRKHWGGHWGNSYGKQPWGGYLRYWDKENDEVDDEEKDAYWAQREEFWKQQKEERNANWEKRQKEREEFWKQQNEDPNVNWEERQKEKEEYWKKQNEYRNENWEVRQKEREERRKQWYENNVIVEPNTGTEPVITEEDFVFPLWDGNHHGNNYESGSNHHDIGTMDVMGWPDKAMPSWGPKPSETPSWPLDHSWGPKPTGTPSWPLDHSWGGHHESRGIDGDLPDDLADHMAWLASLLPDTTETDLGMPDSWEPMTHTSTHFDFDMMGSKTEDKPKKRTYCPKETQRT